MNLSALFVFCVLTVLTANAQTASDTTLKRAVGDITGRVVTATTQAPVAGATVAVLGTTRGAITKPDGRFVVRGVPAGVVTLRVSFVGFETAVKSDVVVSSGKPVTVDVALVESVRTTDEIVVTADAFATTPQTITSTQTLTAEEVRRAPGVQEDVVRAIALLPGVAVTAAGRNDLAVRGGAPFENLFLVDNIEVPNINHFGSQGSTGGPLSIINIDFVRDVSLSTGGFGARFGDRLSSVTNIQLRDGNDQQFGGELNLSATGVGLIAEGPIGKKGTYLLSVRRSYLDLIFNLAGFGFVPEYYDLTAKVSYELDNNNSLSFLTIGALGTVTFNNDSADNRFENSRVAAPSQNQYFSGITWKHLFDQGYINTTLGRTFTAYNTTQQDSLGSTIFRNTSDEGENSLRVDAVWIPSDDFEVNAGLSGRYASALRYDILMPGFARLNASGVPTPLRVDTTFTALRGGIYGQLFWNLSPQLRLGLGGRVDAYSYLNTNFVVSPRLSLSYRLDERNTISFSGGRYYQPPQFIWLIGDPRNGPTLDPLRADQGVIAWELRAADDLKIQVEAYYKSYANYPIRLFRPQAVLAPTGFDDITTDIPFGLEPISSTGSGYAYGIEFFIQKRLSQDIPLYGLASISLNTTRFTAADGVERPGAFDTPIIGSIAVGWRPSDDWEVSSKLRLSEGIPATPFIVSSAASQETGFPVGSIDFRSYNADGRLPFFYALDLRADKRWFFDGWQLITYIDVQNITGRKNVNGRKWNVRDQAIELQESIGVLPSIGVNIEF